jgi:hypothetical protein
MLKNKKVKSRKTRNPVKKKKVPYVPKEGIYLNLPYESFCELSCLFFAEELIQLGYVATVTRPPSYVLCDPLISSYAQQLKRGSKMVSQTISNGVTYTPDFEIWFTGKALGVFCWDIADQSKWDKNLLVAQKREITLNSVKTVLYCATVEVKPDFSRNSTTPKSVQSMKWLYQKHSIFVNLFRPNRIFQGLFVPELYKYTERGTPRKLNFKPKSLHEYLKHVIKN